LNILHACKFAILQTCNWQEFNFASVGPEHLPETGSEINFPTFQKKKTFQKRTFSKNLNLFIFLIQSKAKNYYVILASVFFIFFGKMEIMGKFLFVCLPNI